MITVATVPITVATEPQVNKEGGGAGRGEEEDGQGRTEDTSKQNRRVRSTTREACRKKGKVRPFVSVFIIIKRHSLWLIGLNLFALCVLCVVRTESII